MRRWWIAALSVAALALPAPGAGATPGTHASDRAKQALAKVQQLERGNGVRTGRELSPALNELFAALPSLTGDDRLAAQAILARPDDTQQDPAGTHKWDPSALPTQDKRCTAHFCVHFVKSSADASTPTYAQSMADLFENEVYPCENGTAAAACAGSPGLGWRDPPPDDGHGGDNRVDIYIEDLYSTEKVYGYVALDPNQTSDPSVPHSSYLVMDNDYTRYGDGSAASGTAAEQVTAAHEYNHVLQNGYDYLEDPWMFESTAVYMEDKVYPASNDYLRYVNAFVANPKQPLTAFPDSNLKAYGSAVWNHWLDHRFGAAAVRGAWEQSLAASNFAPSAYGLAIGAAGGDGFPQEFDRFATAVAEWQVPGEGFPDSYPDMGRDGILPTGTQTVPFGLPHTTFAFFDVPVPASAPATIRLTGTLPSGTAGAIALVGRTGADPGSGDVTTNLTQMPSGGTAAASLDNPAQYGRITAIVVNSDPSQNGYDQQADDYVFTKDAPGVTLAMAEPGPPIPATGSATEIQDHHAMVNASIDPHLLDTTWSIEYGKTIGYGQQTVRFQVPASTVGSAAVVSGLDNLQARTTYHYRVLATNSAGTMAGADMTFRTARDVTPPKVSLVLKRQRATRVRRGGLVYRARCSERCTGLAEVVLSRARARRLGLPVVIARTRVNLPARKRFSTLRARLGSRAKRRFLHLSRGFPLALRLTVADSSRNRVSVRRRGSVTRS